MGRKKGGFPLRVENLLSEAGASVYAWYDDELTKKLDPDGSAGRRSDAIEVAVFLGGMAITTYLLAATTGHAVLMPALAVAYILANYFFGRGFAPSAWGQTLTLTAVMTAFTVNTPSGLWAAVGCAAIGWLLAQVVMHAYREAALFAFHAGVTASMAGLLTAGATGAPLVLTAFGGGAAFAWIVAYFLQGRRAMSIGLVRLRKEQFSWTLPDPPTTIPLLLRRRAHKFERDATAQRKNGLRSQEDASIDIKKIGGAGERRTGLLLLGMKRGRWTRIAHDVQIPGATQGGNADHVVLARSGGWVLDSKQFGSVKDPGVVRRTNTGDIVHATGRGSRSLEQTLNTVAWAVRGIRDEMRVPFRGLLVVHNADVEPGLSVLVPPREGRMDGDVTVDIISSRFLIAYLDSAATIMSPREVSSAHWSLHAKLVSATTGGSAHLVAPIGGGPVVVPSVKAAPQEPAAPHSPAAGLRDAMSGFLGRRRAPVRVSPPGDAVAPLVAADGGSLSDDRKREVMGMPSPGYAGETPPDVSERTVRERWAQIDLAEPAALDDVQEDLRGTRRGSRVSYLGFTADSSDVVSLDLVAASAPCQGVDGPFVWACSPEQWAVHERTGNPVWVSTYSLVNIALLGQEGV